MESREGAQKTKASVHKQNRKEKQAIVIKDFRPRAQATVWSNTMCCAKLVRITPAKISL